MEIMITIMIMITTNTKAKTARKQPVTGVIGLWAEVIDHRAGAS